MPQTSAECPFCSQPFRPGEGKVEVEEWGGAFHAPCYTIKARIERHRAEDAKAAAEKSGRSEPAVARTDYGEAEKKTSVHRCDRCGEHIMLNDTWVESYAHGFGYMRYHKACAPKDEAQTIVEAAKAEAVKIANDAAKLPDPPLGSGGGAESPEGVPCDRCALLIYPNEKSVEWHDGFRKKRFHEVCGPLAIPNPDDPPAEPEHGPQSTRLFVQFCKEFKASGAKFAVAYLSRGYPVAKVQEILDDPKLTHRELNSMVGHVFSKIKDAVGSDDVAARLVLMQSNSGKRFTIVRGGRFETDPTLWMEFLQAIR